MKFTHILTISLLAFSISCKNSPKEKILLPEKDTIKTKPVQIKYTEVKLNPKAKKLVKDWIEYQNVDTFILQYHHISSTDALFNAKELSEFAQQLKDSIRIEKFQISSVKIRLNVLYNETLRLADMATINNISEKEVLEESENILNAYSALNLKINNLIKQDHLNSEINVFIEEVINSSNSDTLNKETRDTIQK